MFKGLFNYDNAFWRFMGRIGDFVLLSILFFVCSIPILSFGVALCAVYSVIFSMIEGRDSGVIKGFIKGIKQNFRHGIILSIIFLLVFGILYVDFKLFPLIGISETVYSAMLGFMLLIFMVFFSIFIYVFPMEARYTNTLFNLFKNAAILSFKNLPKTVLMVIIDISLIFIGFMSPIYIPQLFIIPLLIMIPLTAWINSALLKNELKLIPEEKLIL